MSDYFSHDIKLQPGTKARAEDVNARFDAIVLGFDKLPAAHPTLNGFADAVAVGDPTNPAHAVSAAKAMGGGLSYATDTGIANAYVVSLTLAPQSYSEGLTLSFKAANANTGPSTVNVNGLGIKQLTRSNGNAIVAGDIAAGQIVTIIYNGTKFLGTAAFQGQFDELADSCQALSDSAGVSATTAITQAGLATTAKTQAETARTNAQTSETNSLASKNSAESASVSANQAKTDTLAILGSAGAIAAAVTTTNNNATSTNNDKIATAADRVQTGLDRAQVNTDKNTATTQAGIATTQAGTATTQAGNASTSAGTATTQAGIATTQAGIATTKAAEAAASAAEALSGGGGGGLEWSVETTNKTTETNKGFLMDTSSAVKVVTLHATPTVGDTVAVGDLKGTFAINGCTVARNSMLIQGLAEDLFLNVKNQRVTLVYSGATDGWIITELEPNNSQFEYMPYAVMHIQERYAQNTFIPARSAGDSIIPFNFTSKNEISGALLNSNQITIPPGDYEIEGDVTVSPNTAGSAYRLSVKTTGGTELLSKSSYVYNGAPNILIDGPFSLTVGATITVSLWSGVVGYTGPVASNQGVEVYSNLKITKIGGNYAPKPVISSARYQTVPNLNTEGGIMGGDVTVSGNTLTIGKTSCLDSTLAIPLSTTSDSTVVLPSTVNQDFYVFIVRLVAGGACTMKAYTTYAGPASDTDIDAFRFVSYAKNNGSGVTMPFKQVGDRIDWLSATSLPVLTASITSSFVYYANTIIPPAMFKDITLRFTGWTAVYISIDGAYLEASSTVPSSGVYLKYNSSSEAVYIRSATLRR